jgi:hypothetical protein
MKAYPDESVTNTNIKMCVAWNNKNLAAPLCLSFN